MDQPSPQAIRLEDYEAPAFAITHLDLSFVLGEEFTEVRSRFGFKRERAGLPLYLHGEELELISVSLNGGALDEGAYQLGEDGLQIMEPGDDGEVEIITRIKPQENTALSGLYKSSGNFCTQCEAEGFRRITFFPDRPDVLTTYQVRIEAEKARYPVLLSNGNLVEEGDLEEGWHYAVWDDPFPKPSYLFALVAGDLACLEDHFITCSGKDVTLRIFTVPEDSDKCGHAMESLKKSMKWDEDVFGLEYDLEIYNIVAVSDFNMGAMENKSLNVFNTSCVLATPQTATDMNFGVVESVIAHEYFHNWTGNRVTCRDWFQLSLKEGLTVFRDQQFSADMNSAAVERIESVKALRARQFPEDAGPLAHPVRPDSYIEINNFYTATVYQKGAEVIRMMHTLLGQENFRKGMDLYFERHDGTAATCDDFVAAMQDASGIDLSHFKLWYSQAGTPHLKVRGEYDEKAATYTLSVEQSAKPTPGQPEKEPLHIPLTVGLVGRDGNDVPLTFEGENSGPTSRVLDVQEGSQTFVFTGINEKPVHSVLRGFSAPVTLDHGLGAEEIAFLMAHDSDPFNRWEAGQQLATEMMLKLISDHQAGRDLVLDENFATAYGQLLRDSEADKAFVALAMGLPTPSFLAQKMDEVDMDAIGAVHLFVREQLAARFRDDLVRLYQANHVDEPYEFNAEAAGRRSLKNAALGLLMRLGDEEAVGLCSAQFHEADNMTDEQAALAFLVNSDAEERLAAISAFEKKWKTDALVMDKWFMVQSTSEREDTLERVHELMSHPAFSLRNPNKVRAVIGAFTQGNPLRFHVADGSGYELLADAVLQLDAMNPQIAARLMGAFEQWTRFAEPRKGRMKQAVERVLAAEKLSRDVYEIASKTLKAGD